jgi:carbon storage regulator
MKIIPSNTISCNNSKRQEADKMLVLTRKKDQTIMIGDNIEITVVDIQGDQVRIGIDAPKNLPIHRKEVFVEIQHENQKAAQVNNISLKNLLKK